MGVKVGTRWTEEQLLKAVAGSRAGHKLTPKVWPNNSRVAVCLSFDVDNESYLLASGQTSPTALSAADFGAQVGLPRILALLDKYQIPSSFFIPAVSALLHPEMIPAMHVTGHRAPMKYLEQLIAYMKAKRGVWFATCESIAREVAPKK